MYKEMILKEFENISVTDADNVIKRINTLKDMGLIARNIRVEVKDGYVEYAGVLIDKKEKLMDIIDKVIKHASIPAKDDELQKMQETIKVGTEFTFRKNSYSFSMDDLNGSTGSHKSEIQDAGCQIERWVNGIKDLQGRNVRGVNVCDIEILAPVKKHVSPYYSAAKLQIKLQIPNCEAETWWINFDLDPMCIEIQAEPKPYAFYDMYRNFIDAVIFSNSECRPDKNPETGGGGHISLDYVSAFLDTPYYLKNFLVLYASHVARVFSDSLVKSRDMDNAPFMHEIGELNQFAIQIREFNSLQQKDATEEVLAGKINSHVYTKMTQTLIDMNVQRSDAKHYQAVNLEHINCENPKEKRVEMRRFDAQENVEELLEELRELYLLIQESRTYFKLNIDRGSYEVVRDNI